MIVRAGLAEKSKEHPVCIDRSSSSSSSSSIEVVMVVVAVAAAYPGRSGSSEIERYDGKKYMSLKKY